MKRTGKTRSSHLAPRLFAILLGVALLGVVELALRLIGYDDRPFHVPPRLVYVVRHGVIEGEFETPSGPPFVPAPMPDGSPGFRTAPEYVDGVKDSSHSTGCMRVDHFRASPAPGTRRYFLTGGSAAMGLAPAAKEHVGGNWQLETLPGGLCVFPERLAISGALEAQLAAAGQSAQVVNAAVVALDSGPVAIIATRLMSYHPSGVLLYLGNNEELPLLAELEDEKLPPRVRDIRHDLRGLRLYRLLLNLIVQKKPSPERAVISPPGGYKPKLAQIATTQWATAGKPLIKNGRPYDDVYKALIARFRKNLERVIDEAEKQQIPLYIIATPPRLAWPPLWGSSSPGNGREANEYRSVMERANEARTHGDPSTAMHLAQGVLESDAYYAEAHYELGMALSQLGRVKEGLSELELALAMELSRKRSLPAFSEIAVELCATRRCSSINAHTALKERALKEGIDVYDRVFADHEHLSPAGCKWIAELFAQMILRNEAGRELGGRP